jgi:hypothetical protein
MRRLLVIGAIVLLTCATTVLVWGFAQSAYAWQAGAGTRVPGRWPAPVPESWGTAALVAEFHTPCFAMSAASGAESGEPSQFVRSYGWPALMFEQCHTLDADGKLVQAYSYGFVQAPTWLTRCLGHENVAHLPLAVGVRPVGLVINMLVYAGFWSVVFFVPAAVRRWYVRKRYPGIPCAACGYDRTGIAADAPCPECGSAPPPGRAIGATMP